MDLNTKGYFEQYDIVAKLISKGYIAHGSETQFDDFDEEFIKGGSRGEYGYGFYFCNEAYKPINYGNHIYFTKENLYNFCDLNSLEENPLKRIEITIGKAKNALENCRNWKEYDYYNGILEKLDLNFEEKNYLLLFEVGFRKQEYNKGTGAYKYALNYAPGNFNPKNLSSLFLKLGYDGIIGENQYVIFNTKKLNQNILDVDLNNYENINESKITKIISETIKKVIKESVSQKVYHFCSLPAFLKIEKEDAFKLQSAMGGMADNLQKRGELFYLPLTRVHDGRFGYSRNRCVRISLNGDLLNANFNGRAIDYWGASMGKMSYFTRPDSHTGVRNSPVQAIQSSTEAEDRIFSSKGVIYNFHKYIERIDILVRSDEERELIMAKDAICGLYARYIHIYDNPKDFNSIDGRNEITKAISDNYELYDKPREKEYFPNTFPRTISCVTTIVSGLLTGDVNHYDMKMECAKLLRRYGLERYIPSVTKQIKPLSRYDYDTFAISVKDLHERSNIEEWAAVSKMITDYCKNKGLKSLRDFYRLKRN